MRINMMIWLIMRKDPCSKTMKNKQNNPQLMEVVLSMIAKQRNCIQLKVKAIAAEQEDLELNTICIKNMIGKIRQNLYQLKKLKQRQLSIKKQVNIKATRIKNKSQSIYQNKRVKRTKINHLMRVEATSKNKSNMMTKNVFNNAKLK